MASYKFQVSAPQSCTAVYRDWETCTAVETEKHTLSVLESDYPANQRIEFTWKYKSFIHLLLPVRYPHLMILSLTNLAAK